MFKTIKTVHCSYFLFFFKVFFHPAPSVLWTPLQFLSCSGQLYKIRTWVTHSVISVRLPSVGFYGGPHASMSCIGCVPINLHSAAQITYANDTNAISQIPNYPHYTMEYLEGISSALAHTVIVWIHQTLMWKGDIFLSKFTLNQWQSPISLRTLVTSFVACIFMSLDRLVKVWLVLIIKDLATK